MYVCMYVRMFACMYVCMCMCMYVYMYMYVCIHTQQPPKSGHFFWAICFSDYSGNPLIRTPLGPAFFFLFVERLSSFRGDFLYKSISACPLLGGLSSFGVPFIGNFTVVCFILILGVKILSASIILVHAFNILLYFVSRVVGVVKGQCSYKQHHHTSHL